ncbi:MAG TPA: UrcA family protein [Rhizomicrobium sp.]|nr:UrcA family protein [Rhizomicrobium sp.]
MALLLRPVLAAGLFGLAISSASAQGYDPYGDSTPYSGGPGETVTVIAPRFKADSTPLNGPLERVSLSRPVRYTTADLLDPERSQALRWKVWQTAHEVCQSLDEAYPVYRLSTSRPCIRDAYNDAIVKINARITGARLAYWYGY